MRQGSRIVVRADMISPLKHLFHKSMVNLEVL
jgi:hypothetical protein